MEGQPNAEKSGVWMWDRTFPFASIFLFYFGEWMVFIGVDPFISLDSWSVIETLSGGAVPAGLAHQGCGHSWPGPPRPGLGAPFPEPETSERRDRCPWRSHVPAVPDLVVWEPGPALPSAPEPSLLPFHAQSLPAWAFQPRRLLCRSCNPGFLDHGVSAIRPDLPLLCVVRWSAASLAST